MPRWLAHLLIVVGWLLTPVLAWSASYVGLWAGALAATGFTRPVTMGRRRAFYGLGYEMQAGRGRATLGPYALAGLALGLSTDTSTQELAAQWTLGGGLEWRALSWLALGGELRYRLEDRGPRGFWNPRHDAP